jgi:hypothetical protein
MRSWPNSLGRLDDALRRTQEEIDAECRWRGRPFEITLGNHATVLTRKGRCAESRLAFAEFFEARRATGWQRLGQFANAFVELAIHEQRYQSAASLLGYARKSWGPAAQSGQFRSFTSGCFRAAIAAVDLGARIQH